MKGAHNDKHNTAPRLICTLGGSWPVVPETYAFTNPGVLPLYRRLPGRRPPAVDEIWVVATTQGARWQAPLCRWAEALGIALRLWWPEGMDDLDSEADVRAMADLIHRLVHHAGRDRPPPVLGLAGGRKTMSADLQRAGQALGHSGLVHVLDRLDPARRAASPLTPTSWTPWRPSSARPPACSPTTGCSSAATSRPATSAPSTPCPPPPSRPCAGSVSASTRPGANRKSPGWRAFPRPNSTATWAASSRAAK